MAVYNLTCTSCLGYSHCGCVTVSNSGTVELTDEEASALVELMKKHNSSNVEEINLEEALPAIYEKLDEACYDIAVPAVIDHWLAGAYREGYYGGNLDELMHHCYMEYDWEFEYDEEQYMDENSELDEDSLHDAKVASFFEWFDTFIELLDYEQRREIFEDYMNIEIDTDGIGDEYEVAIPDELIARAGLGK